MFNIEELLSESLKTYVFVFDKDNIRYSSTAINLPLQTKSFLDSNFWELLYTYVHPEDILKVIDNLVRLRTGKQTEEKISFIYRIIVETNLYYIQCHLSTIKEKEERLYVVLNIDITEQMIEKDAELHYEQERFSALASKAPVGIFQLDTTGSFVYCNNEFAKISGGSLEELKGESLLSFVRADDFNNVSNEMKTAFTLTDDGYPSGEFQSWCVDKKGCEKLISFKYNPLINGRFRGIIGIAQDMTSSYRLHEHLQNMTNIPLPE